LIRDNHPVPENAPKGGTKNVPSHQLGHFYRCRKNIQLKDVIAFVEKRFVSMKLGTNFQNLQVEFDIGKRRAQRILKRGTEGRLFFVPVRKNPQEYFPTSKRFEVTEYINNQHNVPKGTTGTEHFKSSLSYALEQQKADTFLEALLLSKYISRAIHKLQLEFVIDKQKLLDNDYYDTISSREWPGNRAKVLEEFVEERKVTYAYYRNRRIVISVSCSNKPFSIETDADLIILYSFFGQLRDRLESHIADPRGRLVPQISTWILKQCDLSKDVPITDKAQVTLPDIQISTAFRVFRLYVKNIRGQAHYRCEESLQVNQPLQILDSMLNVNQGVEKRIDELSGKIDSLIDLTNKKNETKSGIDGRTQKDIDHSCCGDVHYKYFCRLKN
jgi:hypothetical protein